MIEVVPGGDVIFSGTVNDMKQLVEEELLFSPNRVCTILFPEVLEGGKRDGKA